MHSTGAALYASACKRKQRFRQQCAASHPVPHTGRLPGILYGRIRDVVTVTAAEYAAPVATALRAAASLTGTLITGDRGTAAACIEHLRHERAGCAHCLIVQEHRPRPQLPEARARMLRAWKPRHGAVRLSECVQV
jgi:chromosome segregation ATPase